MKEDKIEQLLKAIEHPEAYSDEALERLFEDEEVKECYELYISFRQGIGRKQPVSSKKTMSFMPGNYQFSVRKLLIAAILIGAIILSGIAYATIFSKRNHTQEIENATVASSQTVTDKETSATILPKDTILTFQNAELNTILEKVATYYQVHVEYRNEHIRHIRLYTKWNTAETLEQIVERLNGFEKVNITMNDNLLIAE